MSEVKMYVMDLESSDEAYPCRPATAEEIKAAHPRCRTCDHCVVHEFYGTHYCINDESVYCATHLAYHDYDECQVAPDLDYCRYHTPREGAERGQG